MKFRVILNGNNRYCIQAKRWYGWQFVDIHKGEVIPMKYGKHWVDYDIAEHPQSLIDMYTQAEAYEKSAKHVHKVVWPSDKTDVPLSYLNVGGFAIPPEGCQPYLTPGKRYTITGINYGYGFFIVDDEGDGISCVPKQDAHLCGGDWVLNMA